MLAFDHCYLCPQAIKKRLCGPEQPGRNLLLAKLEPDLTDEQQALGNPPIIQEVVEYQQTSPLRAPAPR